MVRTKADAGSSKVSVAKAPRKILGSSGGGPSSSSNSSCRSSGISKDKYSCGNTYNPQPIPNWQKGIGTFFKSGTEVASKENSIDSDAEQMACSESSSSKESVENVESPKKSIEKSPSKQSPENSSQESTDVSEEKSFTKNGVISDDDE